MTGHHGMYLFVASHVLCMFRGMCCCRLWVPDCCYGQAGAAAWVCAGGGEGARAGPARKGLHLKG